MDSHARESGQGIADAVGAVKLAVVIVVPLLCMLGVLGGIGSFATVRRLAAPWFGDWAWIVPVGVDTGILALLAWDLLAEYLGLSWPVLRWSAWAFIAATVYLNVAAAHGNLTASVMHAAMPVLFVTIIEGIRHLIRQITGLATGTRIERIPLSRWLLAPRTTFLLGRRMVLWHVTSYRDGLQLEHQRVLALSRLQHEYGRWLWRCRAPLQDRLTLRLTLGTATGIDAGTTATPVPASEPEHSQLPQLPRQCLIAPSQSRAVPLSEEDEQLVSEAAAIMLDPKRQRARLSQAALARELRSRGHPIANERLRWLTITARNRLPGEQPELPGGAMTGEDDLTVADQLPGLAPIFTPSRAAEILRSLGLDDMTECALRTRAYRRQIPFHLNGHRITFTAADLREISEGQACRPEPRVDAYPPEPPLRATPTSSRRRVVPPTKSAGREVWRARRPRDA